MSRHPVSLLVSIGFGIRACPCSLVRFPCAYSTDSVGSCSSVHFGALEQFGLRVSCRTSIVLLLGFTTNHIEPTPSPANRSVQVQDFPVTAFTTPVHISGLPADSETAHMRNLVDLSWAEFLCWNDRSRGYGAQGLSRGRSYCTADWRGDLSRVRATSEVTGGVSLIYGHTICRR